MDLSKVLAELRRELERLDAAILSLERLKEEGQRRGRPPKEPASVKRASGGGRPIRKRAEKSGAESA
jgi:hypothetical protein